MKQYYTMGPLVLTQTERGKCYHCTITGPGPDANMTWRAYGRKDAVRNRFKDALKKINARARAEHTARLPI